MKWLANLKKAIAMSPTIGPFGGEWTIKEAFTGAWQRNIEYSRETCLGNATVFACVSLISSDISKLRLHVVKEDSNGIWSQVPFGKWEVLNKPNPYQNRIQFIQSWVNSILCRGNTYVLKTFDSSGNVVRLDVLHPDLVLPMVSPDGEVYYQLGTDNLAGVSSEGDTVPADSIIHDRINCLFHPLVGVSPLFAACLQAGMSIDAIKNTATLFKNGARPSGILTAPGAISDDTARRLKEMWDNNYSGENYGKTAILGDDLKYMPVTRTAVESQLIEQLRWNDEKIASVFHVPYYMVGGAYPSNSSIDSLWQQYYSQCLQIYIESIEECLDKNLKFPDAKTGAEFDLRGLLRMDAKSQVEALGVGVSKGIMSPNEARKERNLKPVLGGNTPYLQQQNFSLEALAKRDAQDDPFKTGSGSAPISTTNTDDNSDQNDSASQERDLNDIMLKMMINRENHTYVA